MLLAGAGEEELAGLAVAIETQGLVLFQDAVDGVAHAVFVIARFGLYGESDGGLGNLNGRVSDVEALLGKGVAS